MLSVRCLTPRQDSLWHLVCTSHDFEVGKRRQWEFCGGSLSGSIDMLQTGPEGESENGLPWFALRVRSQRETAVASHLSAKGYEVFLPVSAFQKQWSDRIKKTDRPLFAGYLFCRLDLGNRLPVLKTPWLFQIVGLGQTPIPVDDEEVDAIRSLVMSGSAIEPWPFAEVGQKVRIKSGTLRGVSGRFDRIQGKSQARRLRDIIAAFGCGGN